MTEEIKVTVVDYGENRNLVMRYIDPITGKQVTKTSGTRDEGKAIGAAAVWEDELRSGRYVAPSRLTWADFRKRVEDEKLSTMPESTQEAYRVALDHITRLVNPDRVAKLTARVMSHFQTEARKEGMKATTLHRHLRHIKAVLRWGERQGLIAKAPIIEMPKLPTGQSRAKSRPVAGEEYDRMIAAVPKVRKDDADDWKRLLRGLWLSGLRLNEAVALDWSEGPFVLDTLGKHPAFVIDAAGQKSRRYEVAPVTPDFGRWILDSTPESKRVGKVFPVLDKRTGLALSKHRVGQIIGKIGRKAGVVVGEKEKVSKDENGKLTRETVKLFASAHSLRRSFCSRWAKKVMPAVLKRLARHANIETTMSYYVGLNADEISADLWANHGPECPQSEEGNTSGNTEPVEAKTDE